jgi:hypothetical protein
MIRAWLITCVMLAVSALATPIASAEVTVQKTTWRGHEALQLSNGTVELVIVTGIGPRIVRYAFVDGDNALGEVAADARPTTTALGDWYLYGGHRLWIAPEAMPATYAPDNGPVKTDVSGGTITLTQPVDKAGVEKIMTVTLAPSGTAVTIGHRVTNRGKKSMDVAAWALTVMHGGGRVIIPTEPYRSHEDELLPTRAMAVWGYTNFADPRWTWGRRYIQLRTDASMKEPQKIGVSNRRGWAGYLRDGLLFVKRFDWTDGGRYADFGVNNETYTSESFVELETMGPLKTLAAGESATHEERWTLHKDVDAGTTEEELDKALAPIVK